MATLDTADLIVPTNRSTNLQSARCFGIVKRGKEPSLLRNSCVKLPLKLEVLSQEVTAGITVIANWLSKASHTAFAVKESNGYAAGHLPVLSHITRQ